MRQVIIETRHEVPDEIADELLASIKNDATRRRDGTFALLLRFMQENPPYSAWYRGGGIRPPSEDAGV